jgi:hypothetical protein
MINKWDAVCKMRKLPSNKSPQSQCLALAVCVANAATNRGPTKAVPITSGDGPALVENPLEDYDPEHHARNQQRQGSWVLQLKPKTT